MGYQEPRDTPHITEFFSGDKWTEIGREKPGDGRVYIKYEFKADPNYQILLEKKKNGRQWIHLPNQKVMKFRKDGQRDARNMKEFTKHLHPPFQGHSSTKNGGNTKENREKRQRENEKYLPDDSLTAGFSKADRPTNIARKKKAEAMEKTKDAISDYFEMEDVTDGLTGIERMINSLKAMKGKDSFQGHIKLLEFYRGRKRTTESKKTEEKTIRHVQVSVIDSSGNEKLQIDTSDESPLITEETSYEIDNAGTEADSGEPDSGENSDGSTDAPEGSKEPTITIV